MMPNFFTHIYILTIILLIYNHIRSMFMKARIISFETGFDKLFFSRKWNLCGLGKKQYFLWFFYNGRKKSYIITFVRASKEPRKQSCGIVQLFDRVLKYFTKIFPTRNIYTIIHCRHFSLSFTTLVQLSLINVSQRDTHDK